MNRLYKAQGETARIIHLVADFDPIRAGEIRRTCTHLEVATAYAFKMSETEGFGYTFWDT